MRTKLAGVLASVLLAGTAALVTQVGGPATAASVEPYAWHNVEIQGGGFVPSIIFNQTQKDLVYARTDIGGAYRLNATTGRWVPLLDWVGPNNWGYNGVASLASDPVDPNRVYVAAGMYTNSWDPNNGAILRSADKGATWQVSPLPFKVGGNMPGRGMGERLAVDPNKNSILYFGAPSGKGLWKSTDFGVTWSQVANFPNAGTYVQDPSNEYTADNQGIPWVTFDPGSSTAGTATRAIYVGVADKNNPVYRSTDAGATWQAMPGAPTGYLAHKGVLDPVNHLLYLATSDTGGPYDGAKGQVWKVNTATAAWTNITPAPADAYGYSGLTIDRQHPGTIMVGSQISWWPDTNFFRSTDGGATWTQAWTWTSYPNRSFRYTFDTTNAPWVDLGNPNPSPPDTSPKLGWMNEGIEIDPFNSDRLFYGTGLTLYGTTDLTKWDAGTQLTIKPVAAGLEETAVLDLISPPSGPALISALGDIGGFRHDDLTRAPATVFRSPAFTTTTSLDFAEKSPGTIVRVGTFDTTARPNDKRIAFSTDGGANWFQAQEPAGSAGGGSVAVASDASRFVWSQSSGVAYSVGYGNTWTASTGLPAGARVGSDRVNPLKFYGISGGRFYVSTNGGATFTATAATGLPDSGHFHAVAGREGDLWLSGSTGLLHSTDSGATFAKVAGVASATSVGLGKAAPGQSYPALYVMGTVDGVAGVFRSDNAGTSWVRINDDQHQYGNAGDAIAGDPRVYGRVYLGTNGRGVLYADRLGGTSPSATPPSTAPPSSPPPSSPPPSSAPPSSPPPTGCAVAYTVVNEWAGGFQADVRITNRGATTMTGWTVRWSFPDGQTIGQLWNGAYVQTGSAVTVTNLSYNGTVTPNGSVTFGFTGAKGARDTVPSTFTVNGSVCASG
jgi:hypothetical protein